MDEEKEIIRSLDESEEISSEIEGLLRKFLLDSEGALIKSNYKKVVDKLSSTQKIQINKIIERKIEKSGKEFENLLNDIDKFDDTYKLGVFVNAAEYFLEMQNYSRVKPLLKKAKELASDKESISYVYFYLAKYYDQVGEDKQSKDCLLYLLNNGDFPKATIYHLLMKSFFQLVEYESVVKYGKLAITNADEGEKKSFKIEYYFCLCMMNKHQKGVITEDKEKEIINFLEKQICLPKDDHDTERANYYLGIIYKSKELWKESISCFERAISTSEKKGSIFGSTCKQLGILYAEIGESSLSEKYLKLALTSRVSLSEKKSAWEGLDSL